MSTIKTNTLTGTTSAGALLLQERVVLPQRTYNKGCAKSWANDQWHRTSNTILDSFNTSSFTDEGTGKI